ncbi:MAG: YerC/YecD family TrpR-related protein [Lachnospiraceae bacterium]|nr:YerC/YecD family TrpR-related protein [Lachnospiraceae bacterium]
MGKDIHTDEVTRFFNAVLTLKTVDECYAFFEDVCTINELLSISQRLEVAHMLTQSKTYLDIAEKTGASTSTISRVNRSLVYGNDGYNTVFSRMKDNDKSN